jgi:hypothetical protein
MKLKHENGRVIDVPEAKVEYFTSKGWTAGADEKPASAPVEIPDGDPSDSWTNAQLDKLAERDGIDLAGAKNKGDRLTAIATHREAAAAAAAAAGTGSSD